MCTLTEKLRQIRLLLLDVDGVLTDGTILYHDNGSEMKSFHVRDGLGIRMLIEAGIPVGIITGRFSKALEYRGKELGIPYIYQGIKHKNTIIHLIEDETKVQPDQMAFMGDDLNDAAIMRIVGVSIAVADAHPEIKRIATITTTCRGGYGAVREICEKILMAQGHWETITASLNIR